MKIFKWTISITNRQSVAMPRGAKILTVQMQNGLPQIWALCDEQEFKVARHVAIYGTGNPIPDDPGNYIGTVQMNGGSLVWHVFETAKEL